jgi:hypothetical protein
MEAKDIEKARVVDEGSKTSDTSNKMQVNETQELI